MKVRTKCGQGEGVKKNGKFCGRHKKKAPYGLVKAKFLAHAASISK